MSNWYIGQKIVCIHEAGPKSILMAKLYKSDLPNLNEIYTIKSIINFDGMIGFTLEELNHGGNSGYRDTLFKPLKEITNKQSEEVFNKLKREIKKVEIAEEILQL